ncbi:MAG: ABC transporter ATP-binding protein [Halanaerobiales bacterium]|nr:ABC transporter ATP-binding protein [Halanaerobiales bacterium]
MNLNINNLSKQYKRNITALKNFSLDLQPGVLGLLGPNGAGKSTLMRIIATITKPTNGNIFWNDVDIVKQPNILRKELGYLPQDFGVYPNLNPVEFLEYMATIKGIEGKVAKTRINELLQIFNLTEVRKRPLGSFSGGMKRRIGLAQALLNDPKLLILDEPTVGLDPEERLGFRNLVTDLASDRIIILSTHIVSDIEATATKIAIISHGSLLSHGIADNLVSSIQGKVWEWASPANDLPEIKARFLVSSTIRKNENIKVRVISDDSPVPHATPISPTLEDAYLFYIAKNGENF